MPQYELGEEENIGIHRCPNCGQVNDVAAALTQIGTVDNRELNEGDLLVCTNCGHMMSVDEDLKVRELTSEEKEYWEKNSEFKAARDMLKSGVINKGPLKH
jgi:transcription elongation factor Elf1